MENFDLAPESRQTAVTAQHDPISQSYQPLRHAFVILNRRLFEGTLPRCLVTLQRRHGAYGYFAGRRFESSDGTCIIDEIALNPTHFAECGPKDVLSTLAHEMAHQWQAHFGTPSRTGYHNMQWAAKMREIGLIPSDTGRPGGAETGQRVSHYIEHGGAFDRAAAALLARGFTLAFIERKVERHDRVAQKKRASKTRFSCPACALNAWAKPGADLFCGQCNKRLVTETE